MAELAARSGDDEAHAGDWGLGTEDRARHPRSVLFPPPPLPDTDSGTAPKTFRDRHSDANSRVGRISASRYRERPASRVPRRSRRRSAARSPDGIAGTPRCRGSVRRAARGLERGRARPAASGAQRRSGAHGALRRTRRAPPRRTRATRPHARGCAPLHAQGRDEARHPRGRSALRGLCRGLWRDPARGAPGRCAGRAAGATARHQAVRGLGRARGVHRPRARRPTGPSPKRLDGRGVRARHGDERRRIRLGRPVVRDEPDAVPLAGHRRASPRRLW